MSNITAKQLDFINTLATRLSYGRQDLLKKATNICSRLITIIDDLTVREASEVIAYLLDVQESR